jgi:hypothetical protein
MLHKDYYAALWEVAAVISTALDDMESTFAPIPKPPDNTWRVLLINLVTLRVLGGAAPFFNTVLKQLSYFTRRTSTWENVKDTSMTKIGQSSAIAKGLLSDPDAPWTPEAQDEFSNTMGQAIDGWANVTSRTLEKLFDGSYSLTRLHEAMSNGKLIEGRFETEPPAQDKGKNSLRANGAKCFFGFAIPSLWRTSGAYPFIINAGHACNAPRQPGKYLWDATMDATGVCVGGNQYYLVDPKGLAVNCGDRGCYDNPFSIPQG